MQLGGELSEWELMEKEVVVCEEIGKRGLIEGNKGLELDEVGEEGGEIDVERDGSDSNLDSSLSDVDPFDKASDHMTAWTHDVTGLPAIRGLSTRDPDLQLDSEEESASQFLSSTEAHRSPGTENEEGEFGNEEEDDDEEERNWEQERERIEAFYRYYNNDPDEDDGAEEEACGRSGRKHMVRFCLDSVLPTVPLQQDSDSSDMDVDSSSSEEREDSDTAETDAVTGTVTGVVTGSVTGVVTGSVTGVVTGVVTKAVTGPSVMLEADGATHREKLCLFLQEAQVTQAELKNLRTELRTKHWRDRIPRMLMSVVKLSLVSVLGVLMFWWATDQLDWTGWV
ncbi:hypothetical protein MATL_G00102490 [Megalops atlanticus]|uniref:Transmembrane protein n=1 Tax=Megalops atlanticus TaxID=7932 RepID=A0A9D3T599_MEGAT|nr:hypothetical protein MATL_G00102490 [Megalops atlanticus]